MAQANPRWGAPRIHGELLKLGIDVSETTVAKYVGRRRQPPSQTWRTFLRNHVGQIIAADFFVVPTVTCRLVFVLVLLAHDRRRIQHVAVTAHPTAAWTTQQLREAFPWDEAPRYLIHDRDHAFDGLKATAKAMGIEEVVTAPHARGKIRSSSDLWDLRGASVSITFSGRDSHERRRRGIAPVCLRAGLATLLPDKTPAGPQSTDGCSICGAHDGALVGRHWPGQRRTPVAF
jgi:hypothetical protein